jgi:hypothetical protein
MVSNGPWEAEAWSGLKSALPGVGSGRIDATNKGFEFR